MGSIIRGKKVFTHLRADGVWEDIQDGAIFQQDGTIVELGSFATIRERHPDALVFGSDHNVVLPGFVNGHHHCGLTPVQLGIRDLPLELWITEWMKARSVDPYLDTAYSAFEMIASGITTVQHIRGGSLGTIKDSENAAHAILRAYNDIGMRVSLCFSARDQNRIVYQDDEAFMESLPADLRELFRWNLSRFAGTINEYLSLTLALRERYKEDDRVEIQLAPANLHWCSDAALLKFAELSKRYDLPVHMHLLETPYQREYGYNRAGKSAFHHIEQLGLAGPKLTLGHGVWTSEEDLDRIASTGTHICHNCSSNFRLRSGIAPVNRFRSKGINVALGIDEAGINDDRNMLQEMRLVLNVHRVPGMEECDVPTVDQVLHMATAGGAATTPFGARIGTLGIGKAADLVLIDFDRVAFPFLDPDTRVLDAILHRATPKEVDAVMVAGEIIYQDGVFARVDRDAVLAELHSHMKRPMTSEEESSRKFTNSILPYVRKFYDGYANISKFDTYYKYNSVI